jgi:hypothetical protein
MNYEAYRRAYLASFYKGKLDRFLVNFEVSGPAQTLGATR